MRSSLFVLALAFALAFAGASQASSNEARLYHLPAGVTVVRGWAMWGADVPVVGATVRAQTLSGRSLTVLGGADARYARTNTFGLFAARIRDLPRQFVILVDVPARPASHGPATLREVVSRSADRPADVNPSTTLLALRIQRHPDELRAVARAKVQHLLRLPGWHSLDHDLSGTNRYFDGDRFLSAAAAHGGVASYLASLARKLDSPGAAPVSFAPLRPSADTFAATDDPVGDLASVLLTKLANEAAGAAGSAILGEVLTKIGYGTTAQLNAIQAQIADVQTELGTIQNDITNVDLDVKAFAYLAINATLNASYTNASTQAQDTVVNHATAIQAQIQAVADDPYDPANAQLTAGYLANILSQINPEDTAINGALVAPAPGAADLMTLAQQDRAVNLASWPLIIGTTLNTQIQQVYEYWAVMQAVVVELETEYDNSISVDSATRAGLVTTAQGQEATWQDTILPAPPAGSFIDTRTGLAWRTMQVPAAEYCGLAWPTQAGQVWTASQVGFHAPSPNSPIPTCNQPAGAIASPPHWLHYRDWVLPSADDLAGLVSGWNTATKTKPAPASVNAWLTNAVGASIVPNMASLASVTAAAAGSPALRSQWTGTEWSLWTSDCAYDGNEYEVDPPSRSSSAVYVQNLTYCAVMSLADGSFTNECVADFAPEYYGCDTVLTPGEYKGPITTHTCASCPADENTQFDFFHPNAVLAERVTQPNEQYWIPWNG